MRFQTLVDRFGLIVDSRVETKLLRDPATFFCRTGDANHTVALDILDLTYERANRAGRCLNNQRLPCF
jgi:hypothetical protein